MPALTSYAVGKVNALHAKLGLPNRTIFYATAQVIVLGPNGTKTRVRALLDTAADESFVTESVAQLLGLRRERIQLPLLGFGATRTRSARLIAQVHIQSICNRSFQIKIVAIVALRITSKLLKELVPAEVLPKLPKTKIADSSGPDPTKIDMLLGLDECAKVMSPGITRFSIDNLIAQATLLSWVVYNSIPVEASQRAETPSMAPLLALHSTTNSTLDRTLLRFWSLGSVPDNPSKLSPDKERCENIFRETHARGRDGRFSVRHSLKTIPPPAATASRQEALGALSSLKWRLLRNPEIAEEYQRFLQVYEEKGHMSRIPVTKIDHPYANCLPHHAVVSNRGPARKLRVVFDASGKFAGQPALNHYQLPGPALQSSLDLILPYQRRYRYVITADIVQMFRQIWVHPADRDLQRIPWRPSPCAPVAKYCLDTVTYGTASAPYLAIRSSQQLAREKSARFPSGAETLLQNTYVDDIYSRGSDLNEAKQYRQQLIGLLRTGEIELAKWAANEPSLYPKPIKDPASLAKHIDLDATVKTLGLSWNPKRDHFTFFTETLDLASPIT